MYGTTVDLIIRAQHSPNTLHTKQHKRGHAVYNKVMVVYSSCTEAI